MDRTQILAYLNKGPPFVGDSTYNNRFKVKQNGGKWHADTKKWKAINEAALLALIDSEVWMPCGFMPKDALLIRSVIAERDAERDAGCARKQKCISKSTCLDKQELLDHARRDLCVPDNEPDSLAEVADHGVTPAM
eukprot:867419-Prymnesium_polylepis.1